MAYISITTYPTTGTRVIGLCPRMILRATYDDLESIPIISVYDCGGCCFYRDDDLFSVTCGYPPRVWQKGVSLRRKLSGY